MTNKKFWLGILVMVLVFGMTVVGCDDGIEETDNLMGYIEIDNYYPIVGDIITATWKGDNPGGTPKWEWFRGETSIGGNSSTYTVVSSDVGNIIKVQVSFSGSNGSRNTSVEAVLNTPATATVSVSMKAYRTGSSCTVNVTLTLSDGRWNRNIDRFDIFDKLVTLTGIPTELNLPYESGGWIKRTFGMGPSFNVQYTKSLDSVPSINLTANIDSSKVAGIRSSTNVYNSLTVGTPSSVSVSQWDIR